MLYFLRKRAYFKGQSIQNTGPFGPPQNTWNPAEFTKFLILCNL
jgi:hypothetical protein